MTPEQAYALFDRALALATADHTELSLTGGEEGATRFANNGITQNVVRSDVRLTVRSAFGNKVGSVRVNAFDDEALRAAVRQAEEIARLSQPDTEYLPPPGAAAYAEVQAWDERTAAMTPEDRARAVCDAVGRAEAAGLNSAGSLTTEDGYIAVGNSQGARAYHRATQARFVCTAMTPDSSGWAQSSSWQAARVDAGAAADRAVAKALAARAPGAIDPGDYTVIMEPAAGAELLSYLAYSMDAKAADEGRSAFSGRLGEQLGHESVTLTSVPAHPEVPRAPFLDDGTPAPTVQWIERGVLNELARTRFWAQHTGRPYTGRPTNLVMAGGDATVNDLVAETEDGVLITRFWYIRYVDPMKLLLTGMTRDGLYRVRDGKVVGGLTNMRFNESPLTVLANVAAMGAAECVRGAFMPAIKVTGFTFSSGTAF